MSEIDTLLSRLDQEFADLKARAETQRAETVAAYHGRQERLQQLDAVFAQLREIWHPRLQALAEKFGDQVQVTPLFTPSSKSARFSFQTALARINLQFSATTDDDVRNVILVYDLEILPILMKFDSHSEIAFPLDKVDRAAAAQWIDDRIISFVRTYFSLHENDKYLKDHMVEDPVAKVRFPKFAAAATIKEGNKTLYFISEETRREYAARG